MMTVSPRKGPAGPDDRAGGGFARLVERPLGAAVARSPSSTAYEQSAAFVSASRSLASGAPLLPLRCPRPVHLASRQVACPFRPASAVPTSAVSTSAVPTSAVPTSAVLTSACPRSDPRRAGPCPPRARAELIRPGRTWSDAAGAGGLFVRGTVCFVPRPGIAHGAVDLHQRPCLRAPRTFAWTDRPAAATETRGIRATASPARWHRATVGRRRGSSSPVVRVGVRPLEWWSTVFPRIRPRTPSRRTRTAGSLRDGIPQ
jgi:hypothetical protein